MFFLLKLLLFAAESSEDVNMDLDLDMDIDDCWDSSQQSANSSPTHQTRGGEIFVKYWGFLKRLSFFFFLLMKFLFYFLAWIFLQIFSL